MTRLQRLAAAWVTCLAACTQPPVTPSSEPDIEHFDNPVIPGFAPDPSIVRVGADFYVVNSSFEYFPALPIYHSRDLVDWTLVGHALSDPSHLDALQTVESSGGIHAATIRFNDGLYYIVTTNIAVGKPVSFVVTAQDPRGPWSAPVIVEEAVGIDPSLFFDDDGRVWYTANVVPPEPEFPGQALIWLQELDPGSLQLIGERHMLWSGCCRGVWAEGPHLYKKDGSYYLLLSEGGTSYEHAISMASSTRVKGPYVGTPRNPLLTHRHLSFDHPVTGVGHADLVELEDGRWYGVALGWRLIDGHHGILGRETFLFPVTWETEREWWKTDKKTFPVMSPATGKIELRYPLPFPGTAPRTRAAFVDEFDRANLDLQWNTRRAHRERFFDLDAHPGHLRLALQPSSLGERNRYSFLGIRQRDFVYTAQAALRFSPGSADEEAGLAVMQNDRAAILLTRRSENGRDIVAVDRWHQGERTRLAQRAASGDDIDLRVDADRLDFRFFIREAGYDWQQLGDGIDATFMSPAVLRGFNYTGFYIGLYASSNGTATNRHAVYDRFEYRPTLTDSTW